MNDPTAQSTEYLQLILSACKFLDLLLVLQTEEFQMYVYRTDALASVNLERVLTFTSPDINGCL